MGKPEAKIRNKINQFCQGHGLYCVKVDASRAGHPDMQVVVGGKTLYFEIKSENDRLSKLQTIRIDKLNDYGRIAFVIHTASDAIKILRKKLAHL